MAFSIKKVGGDYTSISAWASAYPAGQSTAEAAAGEIQDAENYDESFSLSVAGNSTLYMWLRVHPDFRHSGVPGTGHARVDRTGDDQTIVTMSGAFARIEGLEIKRGTGVVGTFRRNLFVTGNNVLISGCYIWTELLSPTNIRGLLSINANIHFFIENCTFFGFPGNSVLVQHNSGTGTAHAHLDNVTCLDGDFGFRALATAGATSIIEAYNCVAASSTTGDWTAAGVGTSTLSGDFNASSDASAPGANSRHNIVIADEFVSLATAAPDAHLKSTATLRNAGTDRSAVFPDPRSNLAVDIDGDSRPQGATFDIGSDEFAEAAPPPAAAFVPKTMWI